MKKITLRLLGSFVLSWIIGIGYLFIALQFSPPRWLVTAMRGALFSAAESSVVYVLPPLLILSIFVLSRATMSALVAATVALVWVVLTVAWWAYSFSPTPWTGALHNAVMLLPGSLIPALAFYFLLDNNAEC